MQGRNIPLAAPIRQNNPWASPPPTTSGRKVSDAEFWLNATASSLTGPEPNVPPGRSPAVVNGTTPPHHPDHYQSPGAGPVSPQPYPLAQRAPHLSQQIRSHSIDTAEMYSWQTQHQRAPTLRELANRGGVPQFQSQQNGAVPASTWSSSGPASSGPTVDPFDAAWAAKAGGRTTNPFQGGDTVTKAFEVQL